MPSNKSQPVETRIVRSYSGNNYKCPDRVSESRTNDRKVSNPTLVSPVSMRSIESSVMFSTNFPRSPLGSVVCFFPFCEKNEVKLRPISIPAPGLTCSMSLCDTPLVPATVLPLLASSAATCNLRYSTLPGASHFSNWPCTQRQPRPRQQERAPNGRYRIVEHHPANKPRREIRLALRTMSTWLSVAHATSPAPDTMRMMNVQLKRRPQKSKPLPRQRAPRGNVTLHGGK